nr:HD domain-containing protein [Rhodococcus sp. (in: high G+C Gram-positive bacteria)]
MNHQLLADTFRNTKLKHMDSAALVFAIQHEIDANRVDREQLREAMELATAAHLTQTRIGRAAYPVDPYIVHPLRNVLRLIRLGCVDTDVLSATALHDTVEDQTQSIISILRGNPDGSADEALALIATHFTAETARLVAAVTNPPHEGELSKEEKNAAYTQHVANVITDPKVFLVKFADFVDNAGSVQYLADEAKRTKLQKKYAPLVPIFAEALKADKDAFGIHQDGIDAIESKLGRLMATLTTDELASS